MGHPQPYGQFIEQLRLEAPPLAHIDRIDHEFCPADGFSTFEIVSSQPVPGAFQPISPMSVSAQNAWQRPWTLLPGATVTHLPIAPIAVLVSQSSMTFLMTGR